MKALVKSMLKWGDRLGAAVTPGLVPDRPALISLLFHTLYPDKASVDPDGMDVQQSMTVADFRMCLGHFLERGYAFVTPAQVEAGIPAGEKAAFLTFDDGYYNNHLALDVLAELKVPAVFYVSTDPIREGKSFWVDVYHRAMRRKGASWAERAAGLERCKSMQTWRLEAELKEQLGKDAFRPLGDQDRPFTPAELADFARQPFVHIGNHTANHDVLTNYTREEGARQIRACQQALEEMVGYAPTTIAYPCGYYDRDVIETAMAEGLKTGVTAAFHRNALPLEDGRARMALGRFFPDAAFPLEPQLRAYRSALAPSHFVRRLIRSGY